MWKCRGVVTTGILYYVQGLVMKTRGRAYNPLRTVIVAIMAVFILSEKLYLGRCHSFSCEVGLYLSFRTIILLLRETSGPTLCVNSSLFHKVKYNKRRNLYYITLYYIIYMHHTSFFYQ